MSKKMLGIDFGTRQLKIYKKGEGIVLSQKTVIAIERNVYQTPGVPYEENKRLKAAGDTAYEMMEKAPVHISVSYPVRNGVIADIENMEQLFEHFLEKIVGNKRNKKNYDYVVAVPTNITEVEKWSFYDVIADVTKRGKHTYIVDKPVAAAMGMNLDITSLRGVMLVDIGADTTEVSIMSLGGIVISKLLPFGGTSFDEAIKQNVKRHYNLYIGDKTAEHLKLCLADAFGATDETLDVYGRDVVTGLPVKATVESEVIYQSICTQLAQIAEAVKGIIERTPPEISSEIIQKGIYLTGGSARIPHMTEYIEEQTELKVNCGELDDCVALGLGRIMEHASYEKLMRIPKHMVVK